MTTGYNLGLGGVSYFAGLFPFINWYKAGDTPEMKKGGVTKSGAAIWDEGDWLDTTTGDPIDPLVGTDYLRRIIFIGPNAVAKAQGCDYTNEPMVATNDGTALIEIGGQSGYGRVEFTITVPEDYLIIHMSGGTVVNPKVFMERYDGNVTNNEIFVPELLQLWSGFEYFRFMDWQCTNGIAIEDFDQIPHFDFMAWCFNYSEYFGAVYPNNFNFSNQGGAPLELIRQVLVQTNAINPKPRRLHVCIPCQFSDAAVAEFAQWFKDNVPAPHIVVYEYTNEAWNSAGGFSQYYQLQERGNINWPADGGAVYKQYGYDAARVMNIVRGVYNDDSRWEGTYGVQLDYAAVSALGIFDGFEKWKDDTSSPLVQSDLFDDISVTTYFGDVLFGLEVFDISATNPAVLTTLGLSILAHGRISDGDEIRLVIPAGDFAYLNETYVTVDDVTDGSCTLVGVDGTGKTHSTSGSPRFTKSEYHRLIEESALRFSNDPDRYPTEYQYFNEQVSKGIMTGTNDEGMEFDFSVGSVRDRWQVHKDLIATPLGLEMRSYEGGNHTKAEARTSQDDPYTAANLAFGHSPESAKCYAHMANSAQQFGIKWPTKFVDFGAPSIYGAFGMVRFMPTVANGNTMDDANPVAEVMTHINNGERRLNFR